ncbi:probable signal peptidase I [Cyanidioschyzon merolae strain 10D]|jgi:signal peptidase|uniref:Signal peptidase complex catalytic subunit SEC11 n=1 Tax=Cyanidioschyzon merolae (strain NIES-3377 / 10D) TaxID=280699 RepID=M1VBM8_CYAM1|nr:probable signal peptidase I [Cyanidioschyzon merolae strain 10D]BAM82759.1 probable signal peptidase I [Cyanidioschyzon merolae strain 10D]|eukprot:XP_005538795.1 probable signal peptidase I [Cyanidioschyzon merolae strain 10D]
MEGPEANPSCSEVLTPSSALPRAEATRTALGWFWFRVRTCFGQGDAATQKLEQRSFVQRLLPLCTLVLTLCLAFTLWRALVLWTYSESPVVVVLSGSMEPGIHRGDILFLYNRTAAERPLRVGDMVVYSLRDRSLPIIHRIIEVHRRASESIGDGTRASNSSILEYFLTKGDNNFGDDRGLYPADKKWLLRSDVIGRVIFTIPKVGMLTILMNTHKWLKYALIGLLSLTLLFISE